MNLTSILGEIVSRDKDLTIQLLIKEIERLKAVVQDLEKKPFPPMPRQGASAETVEVNMDRISPENIPHVERYMHSATSDFQRLMGLEK